MTNHHFANAVSDGPNINESLGHWVADEGMTDATLVWGAIERNTEATLALAHEQRTANLIAYLSTSQLFQWSHSADAAELRARIAVELDLMTEKEAAQLVPRANA